MPIVRAEGNGSCLYISLRLALEVATVLKRAADGVRIDHAVVDGRDERVIRSSTNMRALIVKWYANGLDKVVPGFGSYRQGSDTCAERPWLRGDLLAMEMVRAGHDVPEEGLERTRAMFKYLETMSLEGTWGGTPEYTAFALISKLKVEVFQPGENGLKLVDSVSPEAPMGLVKLLFNGSNHYDLFLDDATSNALLEAWPLSKISS